jgi:hypothetical protein
MDRGQGSRQVATWVPFHPPFRSTPVVTTELSLIDCSRWYFIRGATYARSVTPAGFYLVLETWDNSRTFALSASWKAIGN